VSKRLRRYSFDELPSRVRHVLRARTERLGYLGEFFQVTAAQPDLLVPFMQMTEALKQQLPDRLTEVGALTVARLMGNRYELHQHERLSRALGFDEAWITDVEKVSPGEAPSLTDAERIVQQLIIAMIERRGKNVQVELEAAIGAIGEEPAIALMFLVGRYVTHALIVNSLELAPPVPSIFGTGA